ncbi:MAG: tRNA (guanosine(46)-N7)-methyltransferase TrmB [Pirellulales bacterium]|nr:tRNA (guanosine(46)-N7)-methyltransferase TrmB [Pirellulales bacterium]
MGRRALRKIDPNLDVSRHLLRFEQLPRPWDPAALFAGGGPVEVEVGSGKGLFLRTEPLAQPEVNFLGIEIVEKYARFTAANLARRGIDNARAVHGDALRIFAEVLPNAAIQAVHVYFPDPWWKKRHKKRRVMREPFLRNVERTLVPGGRLHFWTDVEEYFQTTLELIKTFPHLKGPMEVPEHPAAHDLDYRTHFERRMRQHRETVFRAEFVRAATETPSSLL